MDGALRRFSIRTEGRRCLDAGAGSGGFTDCLLKHGAAGVVAVDVGYGQFDWKLRNDPRVELHERTNIRTIEPASLGAPFDLIVCDLSFISITAVISTLVAVAGPGADMLLMVKPQFEAPRRSVPTGGVVKDSAVWAEAMRKVATATLAQGWGIAGVAPSVIAGVKGNREFFMWSSKEAPSEFERSVEGAVREAG